jgi:hypothetical protein
MGGGGGEKDNLLEGSQSSPARLPDKSSVEMKTLEWFEIMAGFEARNS